MSDDVNYINLERLRTFLQEVKRLIPTNYATKTELNNYFPKSGGQLSDNEICRDVTNSMLVVRGGNNNINGASLYLLGKDYDYYSIPQGSFCIRTNNGVQTCDFVGKPSGELTWENKNIDVIEEQGDGYIRYSSGLQICWHEALYNQDGSKQVTYPKSFAESPRIFIAGQSPSFYLEGWNAAYCVVRSSNSDLYAWFSLLAIGFWK